MSPTWPALLRVAGLIGGVPAAALLLLLAAGADPAAVGVGLLATALAALILARAWLGTLAGLEADLRAAAEGRVVPPHEPLLPAAARVAESAARLTRSLAAREAELSRLRRADAAIVEALPDPLLVLAEDGRVLRANAAARRFFGTSPGEGPEGRTADTAAFLRHPRIAGAVDRALAQGTPQSAEAVLPVPVARDLSTQVIPLDPPLADGGRLLVVLADRTQARAAERMRADFVANASHELRTPLASIIGFVETLRGPAAGDVEASTRFLAIIADQADRMRRLIEDLLGLSRIEMTEHQAPQGEARLDALARDEAAAMAPILATRNVTLQMDLAPATAVPADPGQLAQVLRNLLENAVRHGREGGTVQLSVRTLAAPEGGLAPGVLLRVADDGPGIAREHIPRLTERFYRVDAGRARNAGGTGLGLAIVKHIVGHHRGQLLIDSTVGQGTVMRVWLPGR
ncbi:two-component system, OmpR family, phosphate regulon sensor histidine kinase PhoR [Roseomonas rosea]|uniref:histidine kinase n=1 Tax=Muricoccus roseus TaxID=198092 RepID=A0A1M6GDG0_9PROT|nr:ATP-binding protein [Roseomonas rosea]SHJ08005.1 two-component system, OmpR family, phosphate regulon sensor histidine kinase PhoR [Roseomonas rosea]